MARASASCWAIGEEPRSVTFSTDRVDEAGRRFTFPCLIIFHVLDELTLRSALSQRHHAKVRFF